MVRKSRFLLRFLSFHEGPDPRSARGGAIETRFFTSGLGSKTVVFFLQFYGHSWYLWHRNRSKRHQKPSLKTTSWKVYVFSIPVRFLAAFCLRYGPLLRASGTLCHQEVRVFLKQKGWTRKDWCPTMAGGHWRLKVSSFSRIGGSGPSRKRQFSMLVTQSHAF